MLGTGHTPCAAAMHSQRTGFSPKQWQATTKACRPTREQSPPGGCCLLRCSVKQAFNNDPTAVWVWLWKQRSTMAMYDQNQRIPGCSTKCNRCPQQRHGRCMCHAAPRRSTARREARRWRQVYLKP